MPVAGTLIIFGKLAWSACDRRDGKHSRSRGEDDDDDGEYSPSGRPQAATAIFPREISTQVERR